MVFISKYFPQTVVKIPEMENFVGLTLFNVDRHACKKTSHSERRVKSMTCDGSYLYNSNDTGCRIVKTGTGYGDTIKGFVYAKNDDCDAGFVSMANDVLIHRLICFDDVNDRRLCRVLSKNNLLEVKVIEELSEMDWGLVTFNNISYNFFNREF